MVNLVPKIASVLNCRSFAKAQVASTMLISGMGERSAIWPNAMCGVLAALMLLSTCYGDATKAFPINFEFRIQTDEEKRRAEALDGLAVHVDRDVAVQLAGLAAHEAPEPGVRRLQLVEHRAHRPGVGPAPQVDRDVERRPIDAAEELRLGCRRPLHVQTPQSPLAMVERHIALTHVRHQPAFGKLFRAERSGEEPTLIVLPLELDNEYPVDVRLQESHGGFQ